MISMADGSERLLQNIIPGDFALTINEETYCLETKPVQRVQESGVKATVMVETAGRTLRCSVNSLLLVNSHWGYACDVTPGDLVAVPKHLAFGNKRLTKHELEILAIWLAEGSGYTISNTTPKILDITRSYADAVCLTMVSNDGKDWGLHNGDRTGGPQAGSKNPLRRMLESYGLWGCNSKTKFIPDIVFELKKDQVARFLNLFFACDGNISHRTKNTWSLECGLANERLVRQLAKLLHKFGITGAIRHKVHQKVSTRTGKPFESWTFVTSRPGGISTFATEIGCLAKELQLRQALAAGKLSRGNCNRYLPIAHDDFIRHLQYKPTPKEGAARRGGNNAVVGRDLPPALTHCLTSWRKQTATRISTRRYERLRDFSDGFFDSVYIADVAWEEVKTVAPAGEAQTWNMTIEGCQNCISEGIITHNTLLANC